MGYRSIEHGILNIEHGISPLLIGGAGGGNLGVRI